MTRQELMWIGIILCVVGAVALFVIDRLSGGLALVVLAIILYDEEGKGES